MKTTRLYVKRLKLTVGSVNKFPGRKGRAIFERLHSVIPQNKHKLCLSNKIQKHGLLVTIYWAFRCHGAVLPIQESIMGLIDRPGPPEVEKRLDLSPSPF